MEAKNNKNNATIRHYAGAIYGTLSRTALGPVPEELGIEIFDDFDARIRKLDEFKILNETGHRMYSAALSMFRKYLLSLEEEIPQAVQDCREIEHNQLISSTERTALIQARLGQGKFREKLIELWDGKCSVSGYNDPRVLVASHIKPWFLASNTERLDSRNGLLLTPNLDKVFDKGLITFDPDNNGKIIFSSSITMPAALGLNDKMKVSIFNAQTENYLRFHKKYVLL